ncbi:MULTISPECIES: carbohydrate kinase [Lysinibacillus]|jgi:pseudouridine kinase|uniref:Carbohydrate kinase n=1 Tax=Lysinibacillus fusiformis TaxID=28031 RepID=A0A2I0V1D8_9BACI|nr:MULTISPECIES: carbohydrate kinase [Lysinibacillus]KUF27084.1 carbohydrate kinase [Lysinibacillus sp. F5]MEE3805775.1 carbohydrate kinase [Lysinibacillus fusiformis]PKU52130.1 carbohydrate kinase [Lysinibacillus fusiformis]WCH46523.1 winged helix-turn-helix transcriptional regulator [Lysinibacillus sp. OF-1]SCZ10164.1 Sugar or nucleoside kinase, ribokinase family [Lysinibacillus sp. SG9]
MNEREQAVLALIRQNPFMSQQEMADTMNLSRPVLANLVSSLTKQGKIVGRAYILPEENEIICIGGANLDRKFHVKGNVQFGTSNPASSSFSVGGVGRNIAENLGRLNHQVTLLTTAGKDADWQVIQEASESFMNLRYVEQLAEASTGSYTAIMDEQGELALAVANMEVYDLLLPSLLKKHETMLVNAGCFILDLNCPKETVAYIQQVAIARAIPLVIVPVSSPKMNRLPETLQGVTWFICNTDEAETIVGHKIESATHYEKALQQLLQLGAEHVIITAGSKGVYAASTTITPRHFAAKVINKIEDVTGAGDAFVSAVIHSWLTGQSFETCIDAGLTNAKNTLASPYTVRPELSVDLLKNEMEE